MFLIPSDLTPFATIDEVKALAMIEDAEATALLVAPCIGTTEFQAEAQNMAAVKAILRGAILRWEDAGSGATQTQVAGPFSNTTMQQARRGMFWPSEIESLQGLCATSGGAFSVDLMAEPGQ